MEKNKINDLLQSQAIKMVLYNIAKQYDNRMCLNKNIIEEFREYLSKVIMISFVFDLIPEDLLNINENVEEFLNNKLCKILDIESTSNNKLKVEEFFNNILGDKKYIFHGTLSSQEKNFTNNNNKNYILINPCLKIDKIYIKHGIYKAFESGISDCNENNFWVTSSPRSACFYSLQSPEYFARFSSRSDYYKWDIFIYDRLAYYRKDYSSCIKNIKREMKIFNFSNCEKKIVLKNYKLMWKQIVKPDMQNIIFYNVVEENNIKHFSNNESCFEMLTAYFDKHHFKVDFSKFINGLNKIILPDTKKILKKQHPIINKKIILINNKKYIPDFYIDLKYSENIYYNLDKQIEGMKTVFSKLDLNDTDSLIELINCARANTYKAKRFLKKSALPSIDNIQIFYKEQMTIYVKKMKESKSLEEKSKIAKIISDDIGLKYIISIKYKKPFKDVSQYEIYQYRKFLGINLFQHYNGIQTITLDKLNKLQKIYEAILRKDKDILNQNIPLKIYNKEIEVFK